LSFLFDKIAFEVRRLFLLLNLNFSLEDFFYLAFLVGMRLGKGYLLEMSFLSGFSIQEISRDLLGPSGLIFSF